MEIFVHAQTEKMGDFQIIFENYAGLKIFIEEILKRWQVAELQNAINNDCSSSLFESITDHYNEQYQGLKKIVFYLHHSDGCRFSDYASKNSFILEQKLS